VTGGETFEGWKVGRWKGWDAPPPRVFLEVLPTNDFKSNKNGSGASKGVTSAKCGSVADKRVSNISLRFTLTPVAGFPNP
jgi:hypothetical protein